jgi:shikimate kinase
MMASGKSAVGAELARRLGWSHVDLDREIEAFAGRRIPDIFASDGEAAFRRMEAEATARLAGRESIVLSPGGGWVTQPALLEALGPGTLSVWLRVSPDEAVRRAVRAPGERPLLAGGDPLGAVRRLLSVREGAYARADLHIDTDARAVGSIVDDIERHIRSPGVGGPPSR